MGSLALIGAGAMGEAILAGLIKAGTAPSEIGIIEKRGERSQELVTRYGVRELSDLQRVSHCFLVVKPNDLQATLATYGAGLPDTALVISIIAGKPTSLIESLIPHRVVRVMPNTPALVGAGMAAISGGSRTSESDLAEVERLLSGTGKVLRVDESLQDAVTAVNGSGPAYFFLIVEAMIAAGVELGLTTEVARELTIQTLIGAGAMLARDGAEPATLRANVTSPNGTTAAALNVLQESGLGEIFSRALIAARDRSRELASG
jgi:pyrroline-5-carboxylate reductase